MGNLQHVEQNFGKMIISSGKLDENKRYFAVGIILLLYYSVLRCTESSLGWTDMLTCNFPNKLQHKKGNRLNSQNIISVLYAVIHV